MANKFLIFGYMSAARQYTLGLDIVKINFASALDFHYICANPSKPCTKYAVCKVNLNLRHYDTSSDS